MAKAQVKSDNPRVYLERAGIKNMYVIRGKNGHDISPIVRCQSDDDAIQWARAFISSWHCWELICRFKEKK